ncbi:MAG: NAD(P)H-binding protein [Burkholderiaceae bacterium]
MTSALLFGATGLVGGLVLRALLADPAWERVTIVVRRPQPAPDPRVAVVVADLDTLESVRAQLAGDALFLAIGTTRAKTPDLAEYARIDRDYPVLAARLARANGATWAGLVSSVGADEHSSTFYLRTKGEAERGLLALGYPSIDIFRPGLLLGERAERRPLERAFIAAAPAMNALLPGGLSKYRAFPAAAVARAMVAAARAPRPGATIHHWREMQAAAPG